MRKATHLPEKPSQNILETDFPFSEGAAKENEGRSEYQIKHNTNKGKRKRRWWGGRKTQCWPTALQLVLHTRPARENTHQASKVRGNRSDSSGRVSWLSPLGDTGRGFTDSKAAFEQPQGQREIKIIQKDSWEVWQEKESVRFRRTHFHQINREYQRMHQRSLFRHPRDQRLTEGKRNVYRAQRSWQCTRGATKLAQYTIKME